jgi:hypothetical protein
VKLTFEVGDADQEIAVEVRKPNLALVGRYLASQSVEVPAGSYFVAANLPDGEQATAWVEVEEGQPATAELGAPVQVQQRVEPPAPRAQQQKTMIAPPVLEPPAPAAPAAWGGMGGAGVGGLGEESFGGGAGAEPEPPEGPELRVWFGSLDALSPVPIDDLEVEGPPERCSISGRIDDAGTAIAQVVAGGRSVNVVLPRDAGRRFAIDVAIRDGEITVTPRLRNRRAESLLRYTTQQDIRGARLVYDAMDARGFLHGKAEDPIAAMAGAYALLAMNQLDKLPESWTRNLCKGYPWLPDGPAIHGEHLSRLGRGDDAEEVFLLLEERGLPYVSDGLFYAVDRLAARDGERPRTLLRRLRPYARTAETRRAFVTFTAPDPRDVDASDVPAVAGGHRLTA